MARERLHHIIDEIEDARVINLYEFLKDEDDGIYSDEFVAELDKRWENYKNGGKSYNEEEFKERTSKLRTSIR